MSASQVALDRYATLAQRATEGALSNMRDGEDASAELALATAAWSAAMGDASDSVRADLDEYHLTEDGYELRQEQACTCPPDLRARGGWRGRCPAHGGGTQLALDEPASPGLYPGQPAVSTAVGSREGESTWQS